MSYLINLIISYAHMYSPQIIAPAHSIVTPLKAAPEGQIFLMTSEKFGGGMAFFIMYDTIPSVFSELLVVLRRGFILECSVLIRLSFILCCALAALHT